MLRPATVTVVARLTLAALWLTAGLLKVQDPGETVRAVRAYQALPENLAPAVGQALPFLEIALGLLLLAGLTVRAAALASVLLLLVFIAGTAQAWARGLTIDCGCFGGGGQVAAGSTQYPTELARDAALLLAAGWLVARPTGPLSLDRWLARTSSEAEP
jgi:uncharacterized membrane protein YphA (DoxX/SURF4 family)